MRLGNLPTCRSSSSNSERPHIISEVSHVLHPKDVHKSNWVSDPQGYLQANDKRAINAIIDEMHAQYGIEVAVVVIDACAVDVKRLLKELFNEWGIGCPTTSNGLLLCMVMGKHRLEIVTGDGLDGSAIDRTCIEEVDEVISPEFNDGRFGKGLTLGLQEIEQHLANWPDKGIFTADWVTQGSARSGHTFSGGHSSVMPHADSRWLGPERATSIALGAAAIASLLLFVEDQYYERDKQRCSECGEWKLKRHLEVVEEMACDPMVDGRSCEHIVCKSCGYHGKKLRIMPAAHCYRTVVTRLREPTHDLEGLEQTINTCGVCGDSNSSERVLPRIVKRKQHAGI